MKRRRFAIYALLGTVAFLSVAGVSRPTLVRASELPPPLEACLGSCPPARPAAAPPAELSAVDLELAPSCDLGRAASEVLARIASLAGAASDAVAQWSEKSAALAARPATEALAEQAPVEYDHVPLGYLTFVPCHEYSQGILHEYDPDVQALFAPYRSESLTSDRRLEPLRLGLSSLPMPAAVPVAETKVEASTVAELAADPRHSTGQGEVLELNQKHEGLNEAAVEPVSTAKSSLEPRHWFEDYTFGYEYDHSYLALETYLAMQQVLFAQSASGIEEPLHADATGDVEYFETIVAGPSRFVYLRTDSANTRAAAVARAEARAARERFRVLVRDAAHYLNDLGTSLIYLSCDVHTVAQQMDETPQRDVRTAQDASEGLGR